MRQQSRAQTDRDAFRAEHQRERQFARQRHRLLVAAVVARHKLGDRVVKNFRAREFGQATFDIARRGSGIARVNVAVIALAFDEIALVSEHHERVANGSVAVRMIFHRVADDVRDLDETPVVILMQRPQNAPLHRLHAIGQMRNRAVADDVACIFKKACVDPAMQRQLQFARREWLVGDHFHRLGKHMGFTVTLGGNSFSFGTFRRARLCAFDR